MMATGFRVVTNTTKHSVTMANVARLKTSFISAPMHFQVVACAVGLAYVESCTILAAAALRRLPRLCHLLLSMAARLETIAANASRSACGLVWAMLRLGKTSDSGLTGAAGVNLEDVAPNTTFSGHLCYEWIRILTFPFRGISERGG